MMIHWGKKGRKAKLLLMKVFSVLGKQHGFSDQYM